MGAREGGLRGKQTRNHFEAVRERRGNAFLASRFAEIQLQMLLGEEIPHIRPGKSNSDLL